MSDIAVVVPPNVAPSNPAPPAAPATAPAAGTAQRADARYRDWQRDRQDQGHAADPLAKEQAPTDQPAQDAEPGKAQEVIKVGDTLLSETELRGLMEFKAQEDLRKTQVPVTAADYKFELPKDLKLPSGVEFKLASPDDPVMGPTIQAAREWALKNNLSQAKFSELLPAAACRSVPSIGRAATGARAKRSQRLCSNSLRPTKNCTCRRAVCSAR